MIGVKQLKTSFSLSPPMGGMQWTILVRYKAVKYTRLRAHKGSDPSKPESCHSKHNHPELTNHGLGQSKTYCTRGPAQYSASADTGSFRVTTT